MRLFGAPWTVTNSQIHSRSSILALSFDTSLTWRLSSTIAWYNKSAASLAALSGPSSASSVSHSSPASSRIFLQRSSGFDRSLDVQEGLASDHESMASIVDLNHFWCKTNVSTFMRSSEDLAAHILPCSPLQFSIHCGHTVHFRANFLNPN